MQETKMRNTTTTENLSKILVNQKEKSKMSITIKITNNNNF